MCKVAVVTDDTKVMVCQRTVRSVKLVGRTIERFKLWSMSTLVNTCKGHPCFENGAAATCPIDNELNVVEMTV